MSTKPNRLAFEHKLTVANWLKNEWSTLVDHPVEKLEQLAARASEALGITLNAGLIRSIGRGAGLNMSQAVKSCRPAADNPKAGDRQIDGGRRIARRIATQLAYVCEELERLAGLMGQKFNPAGKIDVPLLREISSGKAQKQLPFEN